MCSHECSHVLYFRHKHTWGCICNAEVKLTCGKPFWKSVLLQRTVMLQQSVEVLKGYSMFCLYMTRGGWLILCQQSLSLLSPSLSVCKSFWLWGIVWALQSGQMFSQGLKREGDKWKIGTKEAKWARENQTWFGGKESISSCVVVSAKSLSTSDSLPTFTQ